MQKDKITKREWYLIVSMILMSFGLGQILSSRIDLRILKITENLTNAVATIQTLILKEHGARPAKEK